MVSGILGVAKMILNKFYAQLVQFLFLGNSTYIDGFSSRLS